MLGLASVLSLDQNLPVQGELYRVSGQIGDHLPDSARVTN
jgi:hypothetical protein